MKNESKSILGSVTKYILKSFVIAIVPLFIAAWVLSFLLKTSEIKTVLVIVYFVIVSLVIGSIVCIINYRTFSRTFAKIIQSTMKMDNILNRENKPSESKLTIYSNPDEFAEHTNKIADRVEQLAVNVKSVTSFLNQSSKNLLNTSKDVSAVSEQVANVVSELAKGANDQSMEVKSGTEMLRDVIEALGKIIENMNDSEGLTNEANEMLDKGMKAIELQKEKMHESENASNNVEKSIKKLSDKSEQIGTIVEVINSIAEQTNLLALNAAIEAARAGENGKGFAVVADEVRKLAEQSQTAAGQIAQLITKIQEYVQRVVAEMDTTQVLREEQGGLLADTVSKFDLVKNSVNNLTSNITSVAEDVRQLGMKAENVGNSISNIAAVVEENAASTEQVSASVEQQELQMKQINDMAEKLFSLENQLGNIVNSFDI